MKRVVVILSFISILFISGQTYATLAPGTTIEDYLPVLNVVIDQDTGASYTFESLDEFEVEDAKYKLKGELTLLDDPTGTVVIEELEFDPDPMVYLNTLVMNTSTSTQTYKFNILQPGYLNVSPNQMYGSVTVNLLDTSPVQNGALLTDAGTDVYKAFIDTSLVSGSLTGTPVIPLMSPSYSLSVPAGTATTATDEVDSGWLVNGIPVMTNMGIELQFTLSPGDSASVLSRFEVIPEPATLALLGLGGLVLLRKRKA